MFFIATTISFAQDAPLATKIAGSGKINFSEIARKEMQNPNAFIKQDGKQRVIEEQLKGIFRNLSVPGNATVTEIKGQFVTDISMPQPDIKSPNPVKSFIGLTDNNTVIPPDVMGAAGPNHLMETLNSEYQILNKNGGLIATVSLSAFWSGLSGAGVPFSDP
ncbi:MAG: hypothetical protein ABI861_10145, partial [Panacibacter sp.]